MKFAFALAAVWLAATPAFCQNKPVSRLPPRGPIAGTDQFVNQPAGQPAGQEQAYASAAADLQNYVLTSVKAYGAKGDGATDDTTALQTAINSGQPIYLPCGVYKTTSTLTLTTAANHGQVVRGCGAGSATGAGARAVIQPTSAVSTAVKIDGTPFSGYVQGAAFENLAIDMTHMSDSTSTAAFNQAQAFDEAYRNVRVLNDGANKRAWLFTTGAYTTTLINTQGQILDFEGTYFGNGVTTITVINHDGFRVISNYANGLKFWGGAYQGAGVHFSLTNTADVDINTDVEGSGTYLAISGYSNYIRSHAELGGMTPGFTELSGGCAIDCEIWDSSAGGVNYTKGLTSGAITLNNQGAAGDSAFLSGSATADYDLRIGGSAASALVGYAANAGDYIGAAGAGDMVIETLGAANIWIAPHQCAGGCMELTPSGVNTYGQGAQHAGTLVIQPLTETDAVDVYSAAGSLFLDATPGATPSNSLVQLVNGASLVGWSGPFTGQTFRLNAETGQLNLEVEAVQPATDGVAFEVNSAGGTNELAITTNATGSLATVTTSGSLSAASYKAGSTTGASCSGAPSSSFATVGGLVTHC